MKLSLCQIIALFCTISIGILTVTPFVSTTAADDYWKEINIFYDVMTCDRGYSHGKTITGTDPVLYAFHTPQTHDPSEHSYTYRHYLQMVTVS